jgi:hypothetical protein
MNRENFEDEKLILYTNERTIYLPYLKRVTFKSLLMTPFKALSSAHALRIMQPNEVRGALNNEIAAATAQKIPGSAMWKRR